MIPNVYRSNITLITICLATQHKRVRKVNNAEFRVLKIASLRSVFGSDRRVITAIAGSVDCSVSPAPAPARTMRKQIRACRCAGVPYPNTPSTP